MKKAILFGASGFVGSYLLHELLNNSDYEQVIIVVRKQLDITHPKLSIITGDYHSFDNFKQRIVADDVFITLGIIDYRIEHDYSVSIAKAAIVSPLFGGMNGLGNILLLSSTYELFYPDCMLLKAKLEKAKGTTVESYTFYNWIVHGWVLMPIPEANKTIQLIGDWFNK